MKTGEVVRKLRARGVVLALVPKEGLVWDDPEGVIGPALAAELRRHEPQLARRLQLEAETRRAAEKVGGLMLYWQRHVDEWPDDDYRRRRDLLLAWMDYLDALLARTGDPLEAYGWTVRPVGIWRRVGQE